MRSKKFKIGLWFVIICNLLFVLGCVFCFLFSFQIIDVPNIIEKDHFIRYMESMGCQVVDIKKEKNLSGIDIYLVSNQNSCPYEFSYTVFSDNDELKMFVDDLKNKVVSENDNIIDIGEYNFSRKFKEYYSDGDKYNVVTLNQNSILYMSSDIENKGNVRSIFMHFDYDAGTDERTLNLLLFSAGVMFLLIIVCFYFIEDKIRNNGFIAFIPWYNIFCIIKDVFGSLWYLLLMIIPVLNIIFWYKLGRVFGKSYKYCLLMMLFPTVFAALLAFDDSYYTKPKKRKKVNFVNEDGLKEENSIIKFFKRCLVVLFLIISISCLSLWFEENLLIDLLLFVYFLIYSIMLSPFITRYTRQYKTYTKIKPLIIIILIILMFLMFAILPS